MPLKTRPSNSPKLSHAQRGILALLRHDYLKAFGYFSALGQSRVWQNRELAITGCADILDARLIEDQKTPTVVYVVGWQPVAPPTPIKTALSTARLLALLDSFPHVSRRQPQNLIELKHLQTFQAAKQAIEISLLNDPNVLVRATALILLHELFQGDRKLLILSSLERASLHEKDTNLKMAIAQLLRP